jgi:hypothetical protein
MRVAIMAVMSMVAVPLRGEGAGLIYRSCKSSYADLFRHEQRESFALLVFVALPRLGSSFRLLLVPGLHRQ